MQDAFKALKRADFWRGLLAYGLAVVGAVLLMVIGLVILGIVAEVLSGGQLSPVSLGLVITHLWPLVAAILLLGLAALIYVSTVLMVIGRRLAQGEEVGLVRAWTDGGRFYGRGWLAFVFGLLDALVLGAVILLVLGLVHARLLWLAVLVGLAGTALAILVGMVVLLAQLSAFYFPQLRFTGLIRQGFRLARQRFWATLGFLALLGLIGFLVISILAVLARLLPVAGPVLQIAGADLILPLGVVVAQFAYFERAGFGDQAFPGPEVVALTPTAN